MGVLKKIAIVLGYVLLVAAIVATVVLAHLGAEKHRSTQQVESLSIAIDGAESHNLIDEVSMNRWFEQHDVHPVGRSLDGINLATLESVAMQHSAVASANAFVTHGGHIEMSIVQREPMMRLRVDGYDHYVSRDGYLFVARDGYSAYVPVLTGNYRPIFGSDFVGSFSELVLDTISSMHRSIRHYEQQKYPIYRDRAKAKERYKSVLDSTIHKSMFMSKAKHASLCEALVLYKEAYALRYNEEQGERERELQRLEQKQTQLYDKINKVHEREADFLNLKRFVEYVLGNEFWSAEITQVILSESAGEMIIKLVLRSGGFIIDFGQVENIERKFKALREFYASVLSSVGWDAYSTISVRYDGQVVCREAQNKESGN